MDQDVKSDDPSSTVPVAEAAPPVSPPQEPGPDPGLPAVIVLDVERHLDPRYVELSRLIGFIMTACLAVLVAVSGIILSVISAVPWWVVILTLTAGTAATLALHRFLTWWPEVEHRHHAYRLGARGIEMRHGVWWRSIVNVPRSRVQHTDVSQGPMERRFGLATLHIHTAGTDQAEVLLPGLDHATAVAIRDHLAPGGEDDAV